MMVALAKVGKCLLKIPVIFAHFPLPTLALVVIVFASSAWLSSCVTHKLEAGARAELKAQVSQVRQEHAELVAKSATERVETIQSATNQIRAIDRENQRAWFEALGMLAVTLKDRSAIERLNKAVTELHNDATFDCRRKPLPPPYLDSLHVDGEPAPGTR